MKFASTATRRDDGQWTLRHESSELGRIEVTAATRAEALEKLRGEIRYKLELCPCTGESYQHIEIELQPD
jgi:hypothetical protein